jgi:hypothetical protein
VFEKDDEILDLKHLTRIDYRQIANELGMHPSAATQRCLGFIRWQSGERERLKRFLLARIAEHEHAKTKGNQNDPNKI